MKCLMAISFYGVVLLNEKNEIEWEITFKNNNLAVDKDSIIPNKICGLDYNEQTGRILVGFKYYVIEFDWQKNKTWQHIFKQPSGIHSCFYTPSGDIIVSEASKDKFSIINRDNKETFEWKCRDYFKCGKNKEQPYYDWAHLNYARLFNINDSNEIYFSCYKYPEYHLENPPIDCGMLGVLSGYSYLSIAIIEARAKTPHCFIPIFKNGKRQDSLFTATETEKIHLFSDTWEYEPEDIKPPKEYLTSQRPNIKYSKGAHYVEQLDDDRLMIALPNHRLVRIINWDKKTLKEFNMPKHI